VLTNRKGDDGLSVYRLGMEGAERIATAGASARGSSAVVHGPNVFTFAEGRVVCVAAKTGEKLWEGRAGKDSFSSPLLIGDKLVTAGGGRMTLVDASSDSFKKLAEAKVDTRRCTSPALVDGKIIVRGNDALYCFDLAQPAVETN
jgi:outer membrane protein assembly factor BamB